MPNRLTFTNSASQPDPGFNAIKTLSINHLSKHPSFMQIWNFYPPALESLYSRIPGLVQRNFNEQIHELVMDGFGALHMLAPYMGNQGYQTTLIIANNAPSQIAWLKENNIPYTFQDNWVRDIAKLQIETIKPDVLFISPIFYDSNFIRSLSWKPALVTGWCASDIPEQTDWSEFDVIFSFLSGILEQAPRQGAHASEQFMSGFPGWISQKVAHIQPQYDVVFCGQWTERQHTQRNAYLDAIARAASQGLFTCGFYLSGELDKLSPEVAKYQIGPRFGIGMYEALRSGRIVFDAKGAIRLLSHQTGKNLSGKETANMRILETTGVGRFLLTEDFSNLSQLFEPGIEIETFKSETELIEKIRYYVAHPVEREAIAQSGYQRAQNEHSMERKIQQFDQLIQKHLTIKQPHTHDVRVATPANSSQLLVIARSMIQTGNVEMAMTMLNNMKSRGRTFENLEMLRGICLLKLGQVEEARQALQTELQNFPVNHENHQLLNQYFAQVPDVSTHAQPTNTFQEPHSPITGSKNIRLIREIAVDPIVQKYKNFQISAEKYFPFIHQFQLYECLDTGYQFYYPFSLEGPAELYEQLEKLPWYYMENKWEHQVTNAYIRPGDLVLEVGCGRGAFIEALTRQGIQATGLEINPKALSDAQEKGLNVLPQSVQDHARDYPEKYDIVCMFQVLEHIADVNGFLKASLQLLKSGGKFVISVPNNEAYVLKNSSDSVFNHPPHHMGLWNSQSLLSLMKVFDLQLEKIEYEPLQEYHQEWGKTIVKNQLLQRYPVEGQNWISSNESLINTIAMMILNDIPGHTILALYKKK